ncbi:MAG: sulfite exporter TauE/SafE family protein [Sphingobacteriia bacterium]|nr:sulfite exporter TauE/SafE family protein [Sphingobacteriia bacterium]
MELLIITAFLAGLGGSIHCVGMCGPLALSLPFRMFSAPVKWIAIMLYNAGRVTAYASIGLLVGLVGRGVNWFGLTQTLSVILGTLIVLSVIVPRLFANKKIKLPAGISNAQMNALQFLMKKQQAGWMYPVGILNGFLPCGLVYMAVAAAVVAGELSKSVMFMTFFGLGTIPAMVLVIIAGQSMSARMKTNFRKMVPLVSLVIGTLLVLRGLNLDIPYISPYMSPNLTGNNAIDCH